jgi:CRISPR-associated protein Cmr1
MPRSLPTAPEWTEPSRPNVKTLELSLKVITPLFGGGYEPRETDPVSPVRAAAIRGHLRFWWRALYGATFENAEQLFAAEENLWGSAEKPGRVTISVRIDRTGTEYKEHDTTSASPRPPHFWAEWSKDNSGQWRKPPRVVQPWPKYALFPFFGEEPTTTARCLLGKEFTLALTFDDATREEELRQTVSAWVRFGGIGARTRRGCGSLDDNASGNAALPSSHVRAEELTCLHGAVALWGNEQDSPLAAWKAAVDIYQQFRQGEGFAREPAPPTKPGERPGSPGRSWWPEPDSIRRITGRHSYGHEPRSGVERGFPRADLGLPIIFHFKDYDSRKRGNEPNDPADATLKGPAERRERFASPVITKAVAENGKYRPLVLILNAPHVWQLGNLRLSAEKSATISQSQIELSPGERQQIRPLGGRPVREALAHFVASRWHVHPEVLP